jgi:hypothetical protein
MMLGCRDILVALFPITEAILADDQTNPGEIPKQAVNVSLVVVVGICVASEHRAVWFVV